MPPVVRCSPLPLDGAPTCNHYVPIYWSLSTPSCKCSYKSNRNASGMRISAAVQHMSASPPQRVRPNLGCGAAKPALRCPCALLGCVVWATWALLSPYVTGDRTEA